MNKFRNYNPDILETIANLSNDEVFTPPKLANKMLDLLPKKIWSDSKTTFLDPAVKTGIFLREITSRLIDGLADEIPDLQERVNHILTKQVFGIGITELTTLMARRTVYCSTTANGPFSICTEFDDSAGNIKFPYTKHNFDEKIGRCEFCGTNEERYSRKDGLENYAYSFIHDDIKEVFGNMKFDVIIGNPPYQIGDGGGTGDSARPIYNIFIDKAIKMNPLYIIMIVPSRWMKGGKGLTNFRKEMMEDNKIKILIDYQNAKELFPSIDLDGGVCYFLRDNNYDGKVSYTYHDMDGTSNISFRYLKTSFSETIIRDYRQYSIIKKVNKVMVDKFSSIVSQRAPFGFNSDLFNKPSNYPNVKFADYEKPKYNLIYGVKGNKGGAMRISKYINNDSITKNKDSINKYKLFFSKAFTTTATVPPKIIEGHPDSLCTETFLKIGDFDTEEEMLNCLSYIETKFFRALFFYNRHSLNISKSSFDLIPLQDFSKPWTDAELYKKYKLSKEEIQYIEDNIDPMGDQDDSEEVSTEDLVDPDDSEFEDYEGE